MKIKISSPKASSRTLATGLHVLRPSGAARPRGRSALVVLRREKEQKETLTPKGSEDFQEKGELRYLAQGPLTHTGADTVFKIVSSILWIPHRGTTVSIICVHMADNKNWSY